MTNRYFALRRLALTALLSGGVWLAAQAQTLGQVVTGASNVAGTYTDLGTAGTAITTANTDDANSTAQNIGFSFGYNGSVFTQFVLNTNGALRFGSAAPSTAALFLDSNVPAVGTDPLQSTNAADINLLMPFNYDLTAGNGTGGAEYRVVTTGTAGSRVCTVQWKNVADKAGVGTANAQQYANISFQVKLYEANGTIEFIYGPTTASANATAVRYGGVGLKGSGLGTGQLLLASKASTVAWSASAFRSTSYGLNTHDIDKTALPDAGRTYRFAATNYCVATSVTTYPYNENFDGVAALALPCGVTVLDANGDGSTWANRAENPNSSPNAMRYSYNFTNAANDWFFTNALTMTAGMSYQLQFKYRTNSSTYNESLEVKVGSAATPAAQTTTLFSNTSISGTTYVTTTAGSAAGQVVLFTPTTSGVYYFGFHAFSIPNQYYLYVDDVNVTETVAPACPQPTAVTVSSITTTTASVAFNGPTAGTSYSVVYGPRGFTPIATSLTATGTASPIALTGLSSNTNYDVYVVATCGTSGSSVRTGPIPFITACSTTTTYPYTENFDGVTAPALPCGITVLDANADAVTWTNATGTANTTPNAMRYTASTTVAANDWFFTNALTLTVGKSYQLQFRYRSSATTSIQRLEVKVGTAATVAGQTSTVFTNAAISNTTFATTVAGGATGQVILFTPTASGVYYFGFHAYSAASQASLYVDDLSVVESNAPACPQPTNVAITGITTTGATVAFTAPTNGTTYSVVYGPRNFTPIATSLTATGTTSPITLAGLTQNTAYDVYVVATCGTSGTSVQTGPIPFATACATVTTFPYTENFDGVTAPALPCGITVLDANADTFTWVNMTASPSSSPNSMRYSYNFNGAADDWFFTNAISMQAGATYQLQFKYSASSSFYNEGLEVKVGAAATVAGQTTTVFSNTTIANTTYATTTPGTTTANGQVIGFTPTTSGVYYFGFHAISAANQFYLYVDDVNVNVTSLASCPTPTALAVNSVTDSRATVTFSGPSVATSYKVSYVPAGTPLTATSPFVTTNTTTALITGLLPDTAYDIYVQGTCGAAGLGITAGPISFRTSCATTTVFPYAQNFDGVTAPALPCGITVLDANADGSGWATNNFTPSSAPNAMRYDYSTINGADDWFFTNALSLQAGMSYQLQFKSRVFSPNYPERMEVKVGLGTTAATQTTTLFYNTAMANATYVTTATGTATGQVAPFVPTTSGIYFIGFHAFSRANQFNIYVDDIQVTASVVTATKSNVAPGFRAEASPVPFGESLTLTLNTLKAGPLQLTLLDAVGRVVRETTTTVPAGASSLAVPEVRTLPAGIYLLTVRQGGNTQIIRVAHE